MTAKRVGYGMLIGLTAGLFYLTYVAGKHHKDPTVTWYSDMTSQIHGRKIYLIDTPVSCPDRTVTGPDGRPQRVPGKPLGILQVDINLQNGQLKVVKNTVPAVFSCN